MDLCNPAVIRQLMEEQGIAFRKEYGQNFLTNAEVVRRTAAACADDPEALILEIGPGIGCMTRELAALYRRVVAVEIDTGLLPILSQTLADRPNAEVVAGDVMKVDLAALLESRAEGKPVAVCANLPYYITTPILMRLLESRIPFTSITVMVQAEVADRLTAKAGSAEYGAITAVLGYYGEVKRLFTVSAGNFMPAPKVNSAVVKLTLYPEARYRPRSESYFHRAIRAAFGQRRKTLVNALSAGFSGLNKAALTEAVASLGYGERVRGECLTTEDFVRLSDLLYAVGGREE